MSDREIMNAKSGISEPMVNPAVNSVPNVEDTICEGEYRRAALNMRGKEWIDFNMFGHQVVAHLSPEESQRLNVANVDGKKVPVRHFGIVLAWDQWHMFADELRLKGVEFLIEPYIRFKEKAGEQATMFFLDPSGNALEFKSFKNSENLFKK